MYPPPPSSSNLKPLREVSLVQWDEQTLENKVRAQKLRWALRCISTLRPLALRDLPKRDYHESIAGETLRLRGIRQNSPTTTFNPQVTGNKWNSQLTNVAFWRHTIVCTGPRDGLRRPWACRSRIDVLLTTWVFARKDISLIKIFKVLTTKWCCVFENFR